MSKLYKLRLVDEKGFLSITNFVVLGITIKLLISAPNLIDWLCITTALIAYNFKRWHADNQTQLDKQALEKRIGDVESSVNSLKSVLTLKR